MAQTKHVHTTLRHNRWGWAAKNNIKSALGIRGERELMSLVVRREGEEEMERAVYRKTRAQEWSQ